jgi:hypothetical protein
MEKEATVDEESTSGPQAPQLSGNIDQHGTTPQPVNGSMPTAHGPGTPDGRPGSSLAPTGAVNAEQARSAIDSGAQGKIAMTDPAAAPPGADEEAGAPSDPEGLAESRRHQPAQPSSGRVR